MVKAMYTCPSFRVEVEGISSAWYQQSSGIRQGCPLSPYLFLLVMNRVFEQVAVLKGVICKRLFGEEFANIPMPNVPFSEILFADDTLIFANQGNSMKAFLWAIEWVSSAYGLKLIRSRCATISLKEVQDFSFWTGNRAKGGQS